METNYLIQIGDSAHPSKAGSSSSGSCRRTGEWQFWGEGDVQVEMFML